MSADVTATAFCPICAAPIDAGAALAECRGCRVKLELSVAPMARSRSEAIAGSIAAEDDARCRFLPELKAETVCDSCGALLSEKAAAHWGAKVFCLPCVHRVRARDAVDKGQGLLGRLKIYDNLALLLVTLLAPLSLLTAPVALYLLIRYRRAPRGLVPRTAGRWWLALVLSLISLSVWLGFLGIGLSVMIDSLTR